MKELMKGKEEPSRLALSLYDMTYLAKCYPGRIDPGVW